MSAPDLQSQLSLAQQVARLPPKEREAILEGTDPDELAYDWSFWGRPSQILPADDSWHVAIYVAGRGSGKHLAMDTPIPTPEGWTTMEKLSPGDTIFDEQGNATTVLAVYDTPNPKSCYRVQFSDGTSLLAGGEHLWTTWTHRDRKQYYRYSDVQDFPSNWATFQGMLYDSWGNVTGSYGPQVRSTEEILRTLRQDTARADLNHCIPLTAPLQTPNAVLPIDPYLLGYWLGDGHSKAPVITVGDEDLPHLLMAIDRAGEPFRPPRKDPRSGAWQVSISSGQSVSQSRLTMTEKWEILAAKGTIYAKDIAIQLGIPEHAVYSIWEKEEWKAAVPAHDTMHARLRALGVLNDKHIPDMYLRASPEQRLALLQGLMDSDGTISATTSMCEFMATNYQVAVQTRELITSLGMRSTFSTKQATIYGKDCGPAYRVNFRPHTQVFRLERKAARYTAPGNQQMRLRHRMITDITPIPIIPMRCITVDSPSALYLAGEGMIPTHNTRGGSEWSRKKAISMPGSRGFLVARTASDVRDTLIHGESGIIAVHPPSERPEWSPSKRLLEWPNGSTALAISADNPDLLRGPQADWALADEIATWEATTDASGLNAWDNLMIATRLGDNPQVVAMTTPKRTKFMEDLIHEAKENPRWLLRTGSTFENAGNLSETYISQIIGMYEGTSLARQELYGEMFDGDLEGTLWNLDNIESNRLPALPDGPPYTVVVGVDPSVAERPRDECGIIVAASSNPDPRLPASHRRAFRKEFYILQDFSLLGSPAQWANEVVRAAKKFSAPVIAEVNQGGALVSDAITSVDPTVRVMQVRASVSKRSRAEPIALLYEQCVVPETHIATSRGSIPVIGLLPGDKALTRSGMQRILWSGPTGTKPVIEIKAGPTALRCTAEHPVYVVGRGFIPASEVRRGDELLVQSKAWEMYASTVWSPSVHKASGASHALRGKDGLQAVSPVANTLSSWAFGTTHRGSTGDLVGILEDCSSIEVYGNTTPELFWAHRSIFTTLTMTQETMPLKILSSSVQENMHDDTMRRILGHGPQILITTSNELKMPETATENARNSEEYAMSAGQNSYRVPLEQDSALLAATPVTGIMRVTVEKVSPAGTSQVWNLMVENQNEFFANGVLTHNCRVHHVGTHPILESQMTSWQPEITPKSPDRVDAAVWALTALSQGTEKGTLDAKRIRAFAPRGAVPRIKPTNGMVIRLPRR